MTPIITRQTVRNSNPPTTLQEISEQRRLSEVWDDDEAPNNGETLDDSQPSLKGKERADPPGGEPSDIPRDTNDPRNFSGDPGDDDPDSSDDGDRDPDYILSPTPTPHPPDALTQLLNSLS